MSGYRAQIEALRAAADAARSASEQVTDVRLANAVDGAGDAMPGSRSISALGSVRRAWANDVEGWVSQAHAYAGDLDAAAERYSANEDAAADDFHAHAPGAE